MARMADLSARVRAVVETPAYYLKGLVREMQNKQLFLWAQAIAFKVLITIVPVLILGTGVLGKLLERELEQTPFETIRGYLQEFLPPYRSEQILAFLRELAGASSTLTLIGVIGLIVSAVILMTTLRVTISNVFQEDWHADRSIVGGYLFDFRMVIQVGLFFILTLGFTIFVRYLNAAGLDFIRQIGLDHVWVRTGWREVFQGVVILVPFLLTTAMFFQLLYFVPKPHPPRRSALVGALVTAVLWEGAKYGFTFYAANVGRFEQYGAQNGEAALSNAFGLIITFVFWVYYSGIVLLLGAIVALLHEKRHRDELTPEQERAHLSDADDDRPGDVHSVPPDGEAEHQRRQENVSTP